MSRNRKRAARAGDRSSPLQEPLGPAQPEDDDAAPPPILHATPDAELAQAQLAVGRPREPAESVAEDAIGEPAGAAGNGARVGELEPRRDGTPAAAASGSVVERLVGFLRGSWRELQRVQWPDRRQVVQATGVVIGFVIVAGIYLGVADWAAGKVVTFILK